MARDPAIPDSIVFRRLWDDGMPARDIAERFGVSYMTVNRLAARYGYPARGAPKLPDCAEFRRMWAEGVRTEDIAAHFGVSAGLVSSRAKQCGLPPRAKMGPKLTDSAEFRRMWCEGIPVRNIARHYGVTSPAVSKAAKRFDLPPRQRGRGQGDEGETAPPCAVKDTRIRRPDARFPLDLDAAILRGGGLYAELSALADERGLTHAQLLARWHKLRVLQ